MENTVDAWARPVCTRSPARISYGNFGQTRANETLKTPAAVRDIDLHPALAGMLREFIANRKSGLLIHTQNGTMISPGNFFRDGFKTLFRTMGLVGVRFHAFLHFREAVLQKSEARQILIDY